MNESDVLAERLFDFWGEKQKKKLLEGKAYRQGKQIETKELKITQINKPLFFEPSLSTIQNPYIPTLLKFLESYFPLTPRGLLFDPSGDFSLHANKVGIVLYLMEPKQWGQGEAIDVIDPDRAQPSELEKAIQILEGRKVSSFVFGRIAEKQEINGHLILRRYYKE